MFLISMIRFLVFFSLFSAFAFVILLFLQIKISSHFVMLCPLHGDRVVTLWRHRCPMYSPATISSHTVIRSMPCHAEEARYYIKTHAPLPLHPASSTVRPTTLPDIWPHNPGRTPFQSRQSVVASIGQMSLGHMGSMNSVGIHVRWWWW